MMIWLLMTTLLIWLSLFHYLKRMDHQRLEERQRRFDKLRRSHRRSAASDTDEPGAQP